MTSTYRRCVVLIVAVVPSEIAPTCGSSAPGAQDLARLVAGGGDERQARRDPGRPRRPRRDRPERFRPAARGPAATRAGPGRPATSSRRGVAQRLRLVVEREVADLRRHRVHEAAGQPVDQEPRQQQVVADPRPRVGFVAREDVGLGLGHERGDRLGRAGGLNARPHLPPIRGRPSARRWSSQTIAGRSGSPASSVTTTVPRWVVSATPGERVPPRPRAAPTAAGTPRRWRASRARRPARSSRAGPGTYGSIGTLALARRLPAGSKIIARTLCVPTSRARIRSRSFGSLRVQPWRSESSTPGFISPSGSKVRTIAFERRHAQRALLGGEVRRVVRARRRGGG